MDQAIAADTVLTCGHTPTPQPAGSVATGYARIGDATKCYACAAEWERGRLALAGETRTPFTAYLAGDESKQGTLKIESWTGAELATVINAHRIKTGRTSYVHGSTMLAITARDPHGRLWYGRGSSGIVITLRRKGA